MVMEATVHLGDAYWFIGRHADALRIFEKLMDTAESGAIKLRAIHRAMQIHMRNKPAKTLELAAMAEEYAQYDLLEYAHVTMSKAMTISFEGRLEESLKLTKESLRVFVDEGAIFDAILALTFIKNYYARLDRDPFENALALVLRAVSLSKEIGDLRSLRFGLDSLAMTFLSCGLFERALETFESSLLLGKKLGGHHQTFSTSFWLSVLFETKGSIETREGNFEEATRDFERGVSYGLMGVKAAEKTDVAFSQLGGYGSLVRLYVRLADMEHAEEFYEKLEKTFEKVTSSSDPWMLAQYYRSRGVFLSAQLKWKQAVESFERSLEAFGKYRGLAFPMFIAETKIAYAAALKQEKMRKESLKQSTEAYEMVEEFLKLRARADRTNVQASIMAKGEVGIGEEFELRLDLVNVSNSSVLITKVKNLVTGDFKIVKAPTHVQLSDGGLEINARETGPFQVEPIKLTFQATKAGAFVLEPEVVYKDRLGKTESVKPAPVKVIVRQTLHARIGGEMISVPILPNRLNTGLPELDVLLYGGIPENNSVILTSQPGDERESLARCFLEAGIRAGQTTFCITTDVALAKDFADKQEKDFFLFVCNPRAEAMVQEYSNVFRIRGVENLTEIDMSLIKAFRAIDSGHIGPKRVYIEIVSDVLLQHHALTTRKWLGCFLADLKSKGFTALAAVNPNMHSKEEVQSVLSLFDGEIGISEKETSMGVRKILRVRKFHRERYLENELVLSKAILN
jgi:tetratricopeptide (TPR) repeat protein